MPLVWRFWVAGLLMTNMGALFFLGRVEAWVVLGALGLGAVFQAAIFARFGFARVLGLGHFHWYAMLAWLATRLDSIAVDESFYRWVVAVCIYCGLSLLIDTIDVIRFVRGEREPTVRFATSR